MEGLELILATSAGVISSIVIKLIDTYRNKQKIADEHSETMADAAKANVDSANVINLMMRGMLDQERAYFDSQLKVASEDCAEKISKLKEEYDEKISVLQSDNESLNIRIGNISRDNTALNIQVVGLTNSKVAMSTILDELKKRLSKYENVTTAELEAVAKQNNIK
jgi:predicted nuclease with TOPRIM domain